MTRTRLRADASFRTHRHAHGMGFEELARGYGPTHQNVDAHYTDNVGPRRSYLNFPHMEIVMWKMFSSLSECSSIEIRGPRYFSNV